MLRFCSALVFLLFCAKEPISACGYNFVGDCSTSISLKINGTQDSFAVAPCPGVLGFNGFALGNLQSLEIARAQAATWESCENNVTSVALRYRVYEHGFPGGAWHSLDLQEDYNTLVGPYTTRYRSIDTSTSLTDGLTEGRRYVLEIYFFAEIDTIGDDFIPEGTFVQNNNGLNYHFIFEYGGDSAPPFVVATTKIVDVKCHGDSTGVAGVTVYGDPNGLFYHWSNGGINFPILNKLLAGTYSVTVTGASGHSESDTIEIAQPAAPLSASFTLTALGCDGSPGLATAEASGGTTPYYYMWENGEQLPSATFPQSGEYGLLLTDSNHCESEYLVEIAPPPTVESYQTAEVCEGEAYSMAGMSFSQPGNYTIQLDGFPNCDTVVHLSLSVSPKPTIQADLNASEGSIALLISGGMAPYDILWDNGSTTPVVSDLAPGTYCVTVADAKGCSQTACATLEPSSAWNPQVARPLRLMPNPVLPGQPIEMILPVDFVGQEINVEILDGRGATLLRLKERLGQPSLSLSCPIQAPVGIALIRATRADGKGVTGRLTVH
ncbi:MAG: hypothetical protein KIS77_01160 [Saprospiraceae bacterium]|nr:hypothetical protein [Saprospiraceae bacterium]